MNDGFPFAPPDYAEQLANVRRMLNGGMTDAELLSRHARVAGFSQPDRSVGSPSYRPPAAITRGRLELPQPLDALSPAAQYRRFRRSLFGDAS